MVDFENLKIGMELYTFDYNDFQDKKIGYIVYRVKKIKEHSVILEVKGYNCDAEVMEDNLNEFEEYTPRIKHEVNKDLKLMGYENAKFRYEHSNVYFLKGVIKAIKEIINEK